MIMLIMVIIIIIIIIYSVILIYFCQKIHLFTVIHTQREAKMQQVDTQFDLLFNQIK